ncbi:MAG: hypothetical protein ACLU9S_02610 [Oscillospiraceae bacterium]
MKVLITGAGGFLGKHLTEGLAALPRLPSSRSWPVTGTRRRIS